jgi:hypothetical protein
MKVEHRIPTTQFGYISVYIEPGESLNDEVMIDLMNDHTNLLRAYNGSQTPSGIPDKDFSGFIDRQMEGKNGSEDIPLYESMSPDQQKVVQIIKRSKKRLTK